MAWSYSGDPADSDKDQIRFLVGDTNIDDQLVTDEEIAFNLALFPSTVGKPNYRAAAETAEAIASEFARKADKSVGPLSIQAKQQRDHYIEMANRYRFYAINGGVLVPGSGGAIPITPRLGGGGDTHLQGDW